MSLVAFHALAAEMFGFDPEHLPAYLDDDLIAAMLLEFLSGANQLGPAGHIAAAAAAGAYPGLKKKMSDQGKERH